MSKRKVHSHEHRLRSCNKLQDDPLRSPHQSSGQHRMWSKNGHMVELRSFSGIVGTNSSTQVSCAKQNVREKMAFTIFVDNLHPQGIDNPKEVDGDEHLVFKLGLNGRSRHTKWSPR